MTGNPRNKNASVYFITAALSYYASLTVNDANRVLYGQGQTVELEFIEGHDFLIPFNVLIFRMTQRRIYDSSFRKFWINNMCC